MTWSEMDLSSNELLLITATDQAYALNVYTRAVSLSDTFRAYVYSRTVNAGFCELFYEDWVLDRGRIAAFFGENAEWATLYITHLVDDAADINDGEYTEEEAVEMDKPKQPFPDEMLLYICVASNYCAGARMIPLQMIKQFNQ